MLKRIISAIIGAAILLAVMLCNNQIVFNVALTAVTNIGLWEFYNALKKKDIKPSSLIGHISTLFILAIGFVSQETLIMIIGMMFPILLIVAFGKSILTNNKFNVLDISATILGIIYVTYLFSFLAFIRTMHNGEYFIWYVFGGAWLTDTFAYFVGMAIGKHKFSEISPKKSIEGCVGGIVGCVIFYIGYTYFLNTHLSDVNLNYLLVTVLGVVVSAVAQLGDFAASSVKRFCDIKDYGSIMPGHGGILDRFDSILLISPIVYICLTLANSGII